MNATTQTKYGTLGVVLGIVCFIGYFAIVAMAAGMSMKSPWMASTLIAVWVLLSIAAFLISRKAFRIAKQKSLSKGRSIIAMALGGMALVLSVWALITLQMDVVFNSDLEQVRNDFKKEFNTGMNLLREDQDKTLDSLDVINKNVE